MDQFWDGKLLDPYSTTLSHEKRAEEYALHDPTGSISDEDIHRLAEKEKLLVEKALGEDFYKSFKDDPVAIFKSLPMDEKRVLIRINATRSLGARGV
jgi:hypothetical protein